MRISAELVQRPIILPYKQILSKLNKADVDDENYLII